MEKDDLGAQGATGGATAGSIASALASHAAPTPGPWTVRYVGGGGYDTLSSAYKILSGPDERNDRVCEVDTRDYDDRIESENPSDYGIETSATAEANAYLIAAAPDLLAMLRELVATHDLLTSWAGKSDPPAIAKARLVIAKAEGR